MKKLILIPLLALCGCALTESSSSIKLPNGVSFYLPKDLKAKTIHATVNTNGTYEFLIEDVDAKMNPAVIDAATAHDAALVKAGAEAVATVAASIPK